MIAPLAAPLRWSGRFVLLVLALVLSGAETAAADADRSIDPAWAWRRPRHVRSLHWDSRLGELGNGEALRKATAELKAGQGLQLGAGTWSLQKAFDLNVKGTAEAPIWIEARRGERPVITRPDNKQNVLNVGTKGPGSARFLVIRGLEFTGGSAGVRLHGCVNVWFDSNEIHHTDEGALTANSSNTSHLYITRNHLHHTGGFGEGMYLGANNGKYVMRHSIVAENHVHHCGGKQGDGIELKQGSFDNWIVANTVHDTNYPAILAYGTAGKAVNVIERNVMWNCATNAMQVQGEAIVRNNLIMGGQIGFHSHDHQGQTRDLVVVHNTIVTEGIGANLHSWDERPGMVFANNAVYSREGSAVRAENGAAETAFAGNVVLGSLQGVDAKGFVDAVGLADFEAMSWEGPADDPTPARTSALLDAADVAYTLWSDLHGTERDAEPDSGCVERR